MQLSDRLMFLCETPVSKGEKAPLPYSHDNVVPRPSPTSTTHAYPPALPHLRQLRLQRVEVLLVHLELLGQVGDDGLFLFHVTTHSLSLVCRGLLQWSHFRFLRFQCISLLFKRRLQFPGSDSDSFSFRVLAKGRLTAKFAGWERGDRRLDFSVDQSAKIALRKSQVKFFWDEVPERSAKQSSLVLINSRQPHFSVREPCSLRTEKCLKTSSGREQRTEWHSAAPKVTDESVTTLCKRSCNCSSIALQDFKNRAKSFAKQTWSNAIWFSRNFVYCRIIPCGGTSEENVYAGIVKLEALHKPGVRNFNALELSLLQQKNVRRWEARGAPNRPNRPNRPLERHVTRSLPVLLCQLFRVSFRLLQCRIVHFQSAL